MATEDVYVALSRERKWERFLEALCSLHVVNCAISYDDNPGRGFPSTEYKYFPYYIHIDIIDM